MLVGWVKDHTLMLTTAKGGLGSGITWQLSTEEGALSEHQHPRTAHFEELWVPGLSTGANALTVIVMARGRGTGKKLRCIIWIWAVKKDLI